MNIYQEQILDHYHHPQNSGKPQSFTHSFKLANLSCGDEIEVFVTVEDGMVKDVHFVAEGCSISIASASMISEALKGKTLEEIQQLDDKFVTDLLGIQLTTSRIKCGLLPLEAVKSALTPVKS